VTRFVSQLPENAQVGLVVYGHQGSNAEADKAVSCQGIETLYPIGPLNSNRFNQAIQSLQPTGYTPIAATLQQCRNLLSQFPNDNHQNVIYIVSDGIETCDGDPVAEARKLHGSNIQAIVNAIGFDVDNEAQQQLKAVAEAGGGEYFSASNSNDLNQIFNDRTKAIAELAQHRATNQINQACVNAIISSQIGRLNACITTKIATEGADISAELVRSVADQDPKAQYNGYVQDRLIKRHQAIAAWRTRLAENLENQRQVTIGQLQRELDAVNRENEALTGQ
jgi:hypothetical protein